MTALPPGFVLDQPTPAPKQAAAAHGLPEGFVLDEVAPAPEQKYKGNYAAGLVRSAAKGATMNWSDELEATLRSKLGKEDYDRVLAELRDSGDAFAHDNPKAALAAELAGGFAVPGLGAARVTAMATRAAGRGLAVRTAAGAGAGMATGAVEGGIAAAGNVETEDGQSRLAAVPKGAAIGAAVGGIAGGVAPAIGEAASRLTTVGRSQAAVRNAVQNDAAINGGTAQDVAAAIRRDAAQPGGSIAAEMESLASSGGAHVKELSKDTMRASTRAQVVASDAGQEIDTARRGVGGNYDAHYQQPAIVDPALDNLIATRPALNAARRIAGRELENAGVQQSAAGLSMQHVHEIDKVLQDGIKRASGVGQSPNRAGNLRRMREDFHAEISNHPQGAEFVNTQREYGMLSDLARRTPKTGISTNNDTTASNVATAVDLTLGNHLGFARRVMRMIPGSEAQAEQTMRILQTRFRNPAQMEQVLQALERMPSGQRTNYLNAALQGSADKVAGEVGAIDQAVRNKNGSQ
jgi:hypothetical protein